MIFNTIKEIVDGKETSVGISFTAENDAEKEVMQTWIDCKSIATIGKDDSVINIIFTDIKEFFDKLGDDSNVDNND